MPKRPLHPANFLDAPFEAPQKLEGDISGPSRFHNRELSWLAFNWRVLEEAENPRVPLLERLRFLSISATNLDEFYTVRVAGLRELANAGNVTPAADGLTPADQLVLIDRDARMLMARQQTVLTGLRAEMEKEVGHLLDWDRLHFLGRVPYSDFMKIIQISRCHIYLSMPFVLSWSLLEAMSMQATVVASDVPSVREAIDHGKTGMLVDFFDHHALAAQVVGVLANPDGYANLGPAARAHVVKESQVNVNNESRILAWLGREPQACVVRTHNSAGIVGDCHLRHVMRGQGCPRSNRLRVCSKMKRCMALSALGHAGEHAMAKQSFRHMRCARKGGLVESTCLHKSRWLLNPLFESFGRILLVGSGLISSLRHGKVGSLSLIVTLRRCFRWRLLAFIHEFLNVDLGTADFSIASIASSALLSSSS